jgi:hypothetical protein
MILRKSGIFWSMWLQVPLPAADRLYDGPPLRRRSLGYFI